MSNKRLIGIHDVKERNLVKGIQLEGLRKLGCPHEFARKYYNAGIDEIIYMDIVASLYERNSLLDLVAATSNDVFIPITVGGGIRSVDDVRAALCHGADKVAINTAAIKRPELLTEISRTFGSQCTVLSIEAKSTGNNTWEPYYDNGREHSGKDVIEWALVGEKLGCGEILLTSVDREGTQKGFDLDLIKQVKAAVNIPVIASGGMGNAQHFVEAAPHADAIAMAHILHYDKLTLDELRDVSCENNIPVRSFVAVEEAVTVA